MKAYTQLKVRPGAKQTAFTGRLGDIWKLDVSSRPVDGKANEEIIGFLAELCGTQRSAVRIVSGAGSPRKLIEIAGMDNETLARVILESHGSRPHTGSTSKRKS